MTDLKDMREIDPWSAVEYPEGTGEAVGKYLSPGEFLKRGTWPLFDEEYRNRPLPTNVEDIQMDEPMVPSISMPMALSQGRAFAAAKTASRLKKGVSPQAASIMERVEQADVAANIRAFPKQMWERVKQLYHGERHPTMGNIAGALEHHPGVTSSLDEWSVWLNTRFADPNTLTHEGAHVASQLFGEWAEQAGKSGPFARLRKTWGRMKRDAQTLEGTLSMNGNPTLAERVYNLNPEEVFARRFAEAIEEGMNFAEATKISVHTVRSNMNHSRDAISDAVDWLNKNRNAGITLPHYY